MLDQITPDEFDERWRADSLDPIDESWYQTGVIAAAIVNELRAIASGWSGRQMSQSDFQKPEDYIPKLEFDEPKPEQQPVDAIEQRWKALASGGNW